MGNGNTLLEEQLCSVQQSGVFDETVLVIGYLAEQIEAKIHTYQERGFQIRTLFNPFWQVSNNLMSLWLARQIIADDDVMITNGDNIFTPDVFTGLAAQGEGIWMSACQKTHFDLDDMKIRLDDGLVARVSKQIPASEVSAESPGLVMVRGSRARRLFLEHLEGTVRDDGNIDRFWLETFNRMWTKGVPVRPWMFEPVGKWQEIDFHLDVERARQLVNEKVLNLHGGGD
jgi:choline kinase